MLESTTITPRAAAPKVAIAATWLELSPLLTARLLGDVRIPFRSKRATVALALALVGLALLPQKDCVSIVFALALVAHHTLVHTDLKGVSRCFQCTEVIVPFTHGRLSHEFFVVLLLLAAAASGTFATGSACDPRNTPVST